MSNDHLTLAEPPSEDAHEPSEEPAGIHDLLDEAIELVADGRIVPMSANVKVNRDDLLDLLEQARDQLPEEIRAARWLMKEQDEYLAAARRERDQIIDQARLEVMRMVERQEVMRAAESRARQIVEQARADARQLRRQVEDYCDQKLAGFEAVLERTARTVQQGRQSLLGPPPPSAVDLTDDQRERPTADVG